MTIFVPKLRLIDVDNKMADHLWSIPDADGAHLFTTRADAYVLQTIC